ncbi:MAG: PDZ domain-containing protein, partial [Clostridia bacterium]|nr:PDZ domain-containing protein [Clostridia bacterium]
RASDPTRGASDASAAQPQPPMPPRCVKGHLLSAPARVLLWVVGVVLGATIIFGCVLFWIFGINYLRGEVTPPYMGGGSQQEEQAPSGDDDFFFSLPDGNNGGSGGSNDGNDNSGNGSSETVPNHSAGLGITIVELQLEFEMEGGYTSGLVITEFAQPSAFDGTAAKVNDMIVAADGVATPEINALKYMLSKKSVGDTMELTLARYENGVAKTFDVTVKLIPFAGE